MKKNRKIIGVLFMLVVLFSIFISSAPISIKAQENENIVILDSDYYMNQNEENVVYGNISITDIYSFNLYSGVKLDKTKLPYSLLAPFVPNILYEKNSSFAFNFPEEVRNDLAQIKDITVKYQYCLLDVPVDGFGLYSQCMKKSEEVVEKIDINSSIKYQASSNYLTWPFRINIGSSFDIPKYSTTDKIINYSNSLNSTAKNSIQKNTLKVIEDKTLSKLNDYEFYVIMASEKTYSSVIIEVSYIDNNHIEHIDSCEIDETTGACIIPEVENNDVLDKFLGIFKSIGAFISKVSTFFSENSSWLTWVGIALLGLIALPLISNLIGLIIIIIKFLFNIIKYAIKGLLYIPSKLLERTKKRKKLIMSVLLVSLIIRLLVVVLSILIIPFVIVYLERKRKDSLIAESDYFIWNNLGKDFSVSGVVRTGKTRFMVASAHSLVRSIRNEINERLFKIISLFPEIDFYELNKKIDNYLLINNDIDSLSKELVKSVGYKFDSLNMYSVKEQLDLYILYYYILNHRNNYLISNFYVYCRETNSQAKVLNQASIELKNLYKTMGYSLTLGLVILEDEVNIIKGNIKSNSKEEKNTGEKEFSSLIGHLYKELTVKINAKQVSEDEIITTRRLKTSEVSMISCKKKIHNFKFIQRIIEGWLSFLRFFFEFRSKFIIRRYKRVIFLEKKYLKKNWFRKKEAFWSRVKFFFDSIGILKAETKVELAGDSEAYNMLFYFPYGDSTGNYNTHDFEVVRKVLEKNYSSIKYEDLEEHTRFESKKKELDRSKFLKEKEELDIKEEKRS